MAKENNYQNKTEQDKALQAACDLRRNNPLIDTDIINTNLVARSRPLYSGPIAWVLTLSEGEIKNYIDKYRPIKK